MEPRHIFKTDRFEISEANRDLSYLFPGQYQSAELQRKVCFILAIEGKAMIEIDGEHSIVDNGHFLFMLPGHLLRLCSMTEDFTYMHIAFDFEFLSDFPLLLKTGIVLQTNERPLLEIDRQQFRTLKGYFEFMGARLQANMQEPDVTKGILFSFILEVSRMYSGRKVSPAAPRPEKLIDRFFSLLHRHYREERSARFYADMLCVSDKHLMRKIKLQTGMTFHFWVCDLVLREAKLQLKSTEKSITEISDGLHFSNSSFFARFFRKHTGMSPIQFRATGSTGIILDK